MSRRIWIGILAVGLLAGWLLAVPAMAASGEDPYCQVASGDELVKAAEVGVEGMTPIGGKEVKDGTYVVVVESSSSMFRVERAELTVRGEEMWAVLTLSGKGYRYLYMGTAPQAATGDESDYIHYVEDDEGKYTYLVPVAALDQPIACAAFSNKKEKWYGRQILFSAESLPQGAVQVPLPDYKALRRAAKEKRIEAMRAEKERKQEDEGSLKPDDSQQNLDLLAESGKIIEEYEPAAVDLADGEYRIELDFAGGSGRSYIESPAVLVVREGRVYARIRWSSPHYDYMKMGNTTYLPAEREGPAVFELPIPVFDEALPVIGDTTAMSTPHEIEYLLTFHKASITSDETDAGAAEVSETRIKERNRLVAGGAAVLCLCIFFLIRAGKKRSSGK